MNKHFALIMCGVIFICSFTIFENVSSESTNEDDCPEVEGNSIFDRKGCLDSDGDGWSNPDENWTINNGADAFPIDKSQWRDFDKDGFGDNSSIGANNIDYWPNDRLRHKPVLLIACDPASHTTIINEKSSFFCKVTNPMEFISVTLRIEWIPLEGVSSEWDSKEVTLNPSGEQGHLTMFSIKNTATKIGLSGGEVQIWVQNQEEPSAVAKLPILIIEKSNDEENLIGDEVSEVFSFSRMHEGVIQVSNKIEEESGIFLPTWLIYLILVIMFSISLKKPTRIFSKKLNEIKPIKNKQNFAPKKEEDVYEEPTQYIIKRDNRKSIKSNQNERIAEEFDYIPKRLR